MRDGEKVAELGGGKAREEQEQERVEMGQALPPCPNPPPGPGKPTQVFLVLCQFNSRHRSKETYWGLTWGKGIFVPFPEKNWHCFPAP